MTLYCKHINKITVRHSRREVPTLREGRSFFGWSMYSRVCPSGSKDKDTEVYRNLLGEWVTTET